MQVGVTGSTLVATEGARVLADGMKRSQMHFRCTLSVQLYSDTQNLESARSERRLRAFLLTMNPCTRLRRNYLPGPRGQGVGAEQQFADAFALWLFLACELFRSQNSCQQGESCDRCGCGTRHRAYWLDAKAGFDRYWRHCQPDAAAFDSRRVEGSVNR